MKKGDRTQRNFFMPLELKLSFVALLWRIATNDDLSSFNDISFDSCEDAPSNLKGFLEVWIKIPDESHQYKKHLEIFVELNI